MSKNWYRLVVTAWVAWHRRQAQTYVTPMMGGGQTAAEMIHIDIFYDEASNRLLATIDESAVRPCCDLCRPAPPSIPPRPMPF